MQIAVKYIFPLCQKPIWEAAKRNLASSQSGNFKKFRHFPIMLYSAQHIYLNELYETFQFWWASSLGKNFEKLSLLTRSNVFVTSMNEIYNGIFYYSYILWYYLYILPKADKLKKIISTVDHPALNEIHSKYTRSASCGSRTSITRA